MMFLSLVLVASPSVALSGVTCGHIDQTVCDSFADRFVATLSAGDRVRVITSRDIAAVLGVERQKQLLGCADDANSSCLAELTGALGVDGLLSLSLARVDPSFVTTARLVHARDGTAWVTASERAEREGGLLDAMDAMASRIREALGAGAPIASPPISTAKKVDVVPWLPGIAGVVAAGAGVVVFVSAQYERDQLSSHRLTLTEANDAMTSGRTKEAAGVALMIAGGAAIATSAVWLLAGSRTAVAVAPVSEGAVVTVSGVWP